MAADRDRPAEGVPLLHQFENHLTVIIGFCDRLLRELPPTDPRYSDVDEMRKAAAAAMALIPGLPRRSV